MGIDFLCGLIGAAFALIGVGVGFGIVKLVGDHWR